MATPLAALLLVWAASAGWAADCPFKGVDVFLQTTPVDASDPACQRLLQARGDYERLVRAARLPKAPELTLYLSPETNAFYDRKTSRMIVTSAMLTHPEPEVLFALAHELGHAVQDQHGEGRELDRAARSTVYYDDYAAFSRRYEAQADGIAQELLASAGFSAGMGTKGVAVTFECGRLKPPARQIPLPPNHPSSAVRVTNAALGQDVMERAGRAMARPGAFDAARDRPALAAAAPSVIAPAARLSDYDDAGRLLPGRFVVGRRFEVRAVPGPPAGPNPVRGAVSVLNTVLSRTVTPIAVAVVNHLARSGEVQKAVLNACPVPEKMRAVEDVSALGWARRIAAEKAAKAARWLGSWLPSR